MSNKRIYKMIELDLNSLIDDLLESLPEEELINFILKIDYKVNNLEFTDKLRNLFDELINEEKKNNISLEEMLDRL